MSDTKKMLQAVINGQSALKDELIKKIEEALLALDVLGNPTLP